ncbi:MAG: NUDIX domain-containing protein [archaeon]
MIKRKIAVWIAYTKNRKILLQDRLSISKFGEEWSFFGGKLEPGETKEDALKRELKEELNYNVSKFDFLGSFSKKYRNLKTNEMLDVTIYAFTTMIEEDKSLFEIHEGDGGEFFFIKDARKLKLGPQDQDILDELDVFLAN